MEKTLVTGGAGFIGPHLVRGLIGLKHHVLVLDDLSFGSRKSLPLTDKKLTLARANIADNKTMVRLMRAFRPDNIIHLAAIHFIPYCNDHPVKTVETNIIGTRSMLEAAKTMGIRKFIMASSAAVYPISTGKLREKVPPGPTDIYGMSKLICEDMCRLFYRETGTATVIARISNVYGPGETNPHVIPEIVDQLKEGKLRVELGNIEPKRDFIHVRDVAAGIISLLTDFGEEFGIFNLGTGKEYSIREIMGICERIMGRKIKVKSTRGRKRKSDRMHLLLDIRKITRKTGWKPSISMEEGLRELLASK